MYFFEDNGTWQFRDNMGTLVTDDCRVRIAAAVKAPLLTRSPYVPYEDEGTEADSPTSEHPLKAEVWASSEEWLFPDEDKDGSGTGTYKVAYHTTARFQSGGPQLLAEVIYSKIDTPPIYFVALSPETGWHTRADGDNSKGKAYSNGDIMNLSSDLSLYAQWEMTQL